MDISYTLQVCVKFMMLSAVLFKIHFLEKK